jgi:hypothetical protein
MKATARQICNHLLWELTLVVLLLVPLAPAQQPGSVVPTLVNFSGTLLDVNGKPLSGLAGVTFYLYKDQQGGTPLWIETQNIQPDKFGHYTVTLGATKSQGLPTDLFASGEARWLGVQAEGQSEQPRVMLLAVPYALKAGDAQTVGGLPPSAFLLAAPASSSSGNTVAGGSNAGTTAGVTGSGTTDYIPLWTGNSILGSSVLFQSGSGSTAMLGLNETSPLASLDVNGTELVRGLFESATTGNANASKGFNSNATDFEASSFNSGTNKAVLQHFEWQAEPTGNNTSTPGATLNLLFGSGTDTPGETGLKLSNTGLFTFVSGQTFPGTGTITGVTTATGSGLTGGGTSGTLTLSLLKTCAANQILQFVSGAWACANPATGTVTSVGSGAGLTGGPVTTSGTLSIATAGVTNAMLANPSLTVTAGTDLTGGGLVALGGTTTLNLDTTQVPQLGQPNQFTQTQFVSVTNPFGAALQVSSGNQAISGAGANLGVQGSSSAGPGVVGQTTGTFSYGVTGTGAGGGVYGSSSSINGAGGQFAGYSAASGSGFGGTYGVVAIGGNGDPTAFVSDGGPGISGLGGNGSGFLGGDGPGGTFEGGLATLFGDGVDAYPGSGYAGYFQGNVNVTGAITAGTKDFKIDHPLDPANKYLFHASVESSEMMNIYTGNITTDGQGHATVQLPEWFEVLNTDFRYQLTVIGQFAQAIVAREIESNRFEITTNSPNVKVSWQVTGVRQDAYAKANPLVVEQEKEARLRGFYIHPELYGAPAEKQIEWARHPQMMKRVQEMRAKQQATIKAAAQPLAAQGK